MISTHSALGLMFADKILLNQVSLTEITYKFYLYKISCSFSEIPQMSFLISLIQVESIHGSIVKATYYHE